MSDANSDNPMTVGQLITLVVACIVGLPVMIFLLVKVFTSGMQVDPQSPTMSAEAVNARIQAVGFAKLDTSGPPGSRDGKTVYDTACASCHSAGLAGSPKWADAGAWAPRISKGFQTLVGNAVKGFNGMPAKGGAADLTNDEVARGVAYMANAAGAKFVAPEAKPASGGGAQASASGKDVYEANCAACHTTGAAEAPKFGDKAAWAPRMTQGVKGLVASASKGKGAMPPKGGFTGPEADFVAAVEYMAGAVK